MSHRPRPSSPFSTDGSTVGSHSLGHQRATRPTRKPRSQGTAPHRRDPSADGTPVAGNTASCTVLHEKCLKFYYCVSSSPPADLPPPPEPPPCQGQSRTQGPRSINSMVPPPERKATSLERTPMSGALSGSEDMKVSVERPARATLDHHHRHGQDRLGSVERGHKTGLSGNALVC